MFRCPWRGVKLNWNIRDGQVVPKTEDVALNNGGVKIDAVYLYADLADSTQLARDFAPETAAKVVRAFLDSACRVVRAGGGNIRSFDGDRVMAIFIGDSKNSNAANCGLKINWASQVVVRPAVEARFPSIRSQGFVVSHCVGVASGKALVVRGGVRRDNDLVSIGRAPNVAAKLSDVRKPPHRTYVTKEVFSRLSEDVKYSKKGELMWDGPYTREVGGETISICRSSWRRSP